MPESDKQRAHINRYQSTIADESAEFAKVLEFNQETFDQILAWLQATLEELSNNSDIQLAYTGKTRGREETPLAEYNYILTIPLDKWTSDLKMKMKTVENTELRRQLRHTRKTKRIYFDILIFIIHGIRIRTFKQYGNFRKSLDEMLELARYPLKQQ